MVSGMTRRDAIRFGSGAGLGIVAAFSEWTGLMRASAQGQVSRAPAAGALQIPTWNTELKQLAPNVYAYIQGGGPNVTNAFVSNAGLIVGNDHLLSIDALGPPLHTKAYLATVKNTIGSKPFGRLINTHHHADHVEGNLYFLPAEIVGHEFCRAEILRAPAPPPVWAKRDGWAEGTEERRLVPPVTTLTDKLTYYYGDTMVEVLFIGIAHTWGDLVIRLPQYRLLFAGDIVFHHVTPVAFNGHVSNWIATLEKVMAMDVDTIVPGHGPIATKNEVAIVRDYYTLLKAETRKRYDAGYSPGKSAFEVQTQHLQRYSAWNNPERVVADSVRLFEEFAGTITPAGQFNYPQPTQEYQALRKAAGIA